MNRNLKPVDTVPDMETKVRTRLAELRTEYDKGQKTLQDLEGQTANVRATLLRISGALQVLQETLGESSEHGEHGDSPPPPQA